MTPVRSIAAARQWVAVLSLIAMSAPALANGRAPGGEGAACGGIAGFRCAEGLWCESPAGQCGRPDAMGTCIRTGPVCIKLYKPVCGCNGETYGNDCERRAARVQKAHDGRCSP